MTSSIESKPFTNAGWSINKKIPQKFTIYKIIKDDSTFNKLKRNKDKEVRLSKAFNLWHVWKWK